MTSPVKPPGGGAPPPEPRAPRAQAEGPFADPASPDPDRTGTPTASVGPTDAVLRELVAALEAGTVDARAAVDTLVARALESPVAAGLTADGRARLEDLLRTTLTDDPGLAALVRSLDRR